MDSFTVGSDLSTVEKLQGGIPSMVYESLPSTKSKKSKTRTKKVHSMKAMYCSLTMCSIIWAVLGLSYLLFDPIVKHVVLKRLVLRNDSEIAEFWKKPPIKPHFKVYFYNLTNPEEFFQGKAQPHVQEVGPYTYQQTWIKENIKWHNDGTMSYSTRKEFEFVREKSLGDHTKDNITLANVPAISAMYQNRASSWGYNWILNGILENFLGHEMWVQRTPEQFVWGYHEPLFEMARAYMPAGSAPPSDNFGFFVGKNQSQGLPSYTMYTGEGNPYNLSKISSYNGSEFLKVWNSDTCNRVQGSDGSTFNPYIQTAERLWFFNDQLCRSMPLVFDQEVKSGELPGYRFVPDENVFKINFEKYPENSCFCDGEDLCDMIGDGMFAVSKCQFNAPIILSWPHFLHANQTFFEKIKGWEPADESKHGFYFDIQPITGTTLSAKARIQINLGIQHSDHFSGLSQVKDTILPLLWFEEGLDELGDELQSELAKAALDPPKYKTYLFYILVGVALTTTCMGLTTFCRICLNWRNKRFNEKQLFSEHKIREIIGAQGGAKGNKTQLANFKRGHAHNPSQGSGKFLLESEDSSKHHSRNSSTGSTPPTFVVHAPQEGVAEENERLLQVPNLTTDQRSV